MCDVVRKKILYIQGKEEPMTEASSPGDTMKSEDTMANSLISVKLDNMREQTFDRMGFETYKPPNCTVKDANTTSSMCRRGNQHHTLQGELAQQYDRHTASWSN